MRKMVHGSVSAFVEIQTGNKVFLQLGLLEKV